MLNCIKKLPSCCCWTFTLHQGYSYIVYFDFTKFLIVILYSVSVFFRFQAHIDEIILIIIITIFSFLEAIAAYISLFKGFRANDWRRHKIYFYTKIVSLFTVVPAAIAVDQLGCHDIPSSDGSCFALSFLAQSVLLIVEIYFTWDVYAVYKKTKQGYYGPLGSKPCLAIMSKDNVFTLNPKAIVIEVEGSAIKQKKANMFDLKGIFSNDDLLAINSSVPTYITDKEPENLSVDSQMIITVNIEQRIKKYGSKYKKDDKPNVWIDKQAVRIEEVNLMNMK